MIKGDIMEFSKERTRELIKELGGIDYHNIKTSKIRENKSRIRKELESLYAEKFSKRKEINEENLKEINNLIEKLEELRKGMVNKSLKLAKTLSNIITIIQIIAVLVLVGWFGYSFLSEGDFKTTKAFKNSTYKGLTMETIFDEIDPNTKWYSGESDSGQQFVNVTFDLSLDVNDDGINDLVEVLMQWHQNDGGDRFEFYTLSINGAAQDKSFVVSLYNDVMERAIYKLNSKINKSSTKNSKPKKNQPSKYLDYTLEEIENEFGSDYTVYDFEGGRFIIFNDKSILYSFGFESLEKDSMVKTIYLQKNAEIFWIEVGMTQTKIIDIWPNPDRMGVNEMTNEFETEYEFDNYTVTFTSADKDSETINAIIRKK